MTRSPWFWVTLLLIAAGVALTVLLGVLGWVALTLAVAIFVLDAILLYSSYAVPQVEPPSPPELEPVPPEEQIPLIVDCDLTMGRAFRDIGDGLALLYLLGAPGVDVRAVTTTYGNGPVSLTTRTTRGLLRRLDMQTPEVFRGASGPDQKPEENEAAIHLVASVNAHPHEYVILATGALTNLRHAAALDPDFFVKVRGLSVAGGVTGPVVWRERRLLERNFSLDPEAAYAVIRADCPLTITLGEAGLTAVIRSRQFAALEALDDPVSRLIVKRARIWFGLMRLWFSDDGFATWESIAAVAITQPELLQFEKGYLPTTIEDLRSGRLVFDKDAVGPVRLVRAVRDYEGFVEAQFAAWHHLGCSLERQE